MTSSSSSMFSVERRNFTDLVIVQTLLISLQLLMSPFITGVGLLLLAWLLSFHTNCSSACLAPPCPKSLSADDQPRTPLTIESFFYLCYQRANLLQSVYLTTVSQTTVRSLCLQAHNHRQDPLSCFHSRELLSFLLGETNLQTVDSAPRARPTLLPWRWQMQG